MATALVWLRRDLRLSDNPALAQAIADGYTPLLVYIHAPFEDQPWTAGAASSAWLHYSLQRLAQSVAQLGGKLHIASGDSLSALSAYRLQCGAQALYFNTLYEPVSQARDAKVRQAFEQSGVTVRQFNSMLLIEPWQVLTKAGTPYKVFTPFWRNVFSQLQLRAEYPSPKSLAAFPGIPGLDIESLELLPSRQWHLEFWQHWQPGELGAQELLEIFCDSAINGYKGQRNLPDRTGTSKLSPHLHFGEISVHQIWRQIQKMKAASALAEDVSCYFSELGWREFSAYLLHHFPQSSRQDLNPQFQHFKWATPDPELLDKWKHGWTGIPIVDAGMRELMHTGWMHNRIRMVVASFLCKNLRYHWMEGARWFWDALLDADLANNSQGWQWVAGTGCDASPYFRIFNPVAQAERFDPSARYIKRWVPELERIPVPLVFAPWKDAAACMALAPDYPSSPICDLAESRKQALLAYSQR